MQTTVVILLPQETEPEEKEPLKKESFFLLSVDDLSIPWANTSASSLVLAGCLIGGWREGREVGGEGRKVGVEYYPSAYSSS